MGGLRAALSDATASRPHPVARGIRWLGLAAVLLLLVGAFTPLSNAINTWMGGTAELERADAIVVVGRGGTDADGVLSNRSLRRTLLGISLHRDRLADLLVFSGGFEETKARATLARGLGVPPASVVVAASSNTTTEEARAIRALLAPRGVRRVLLVADPVDMPRTRDLLGAHGFVVLRAPTASQGPGNPESRLGLLREIAMEMTAWLYNRVAGAVRPTGP